MSSENLKSLANEDLSEKKVPKTKSGSNKVDAAISKGKILNESEQDNDSKELTIKICNTDNKKLMGLTSALRINREIIIESSMNYVYYYIEKLKLSFDKIIQEMGDPGEGLDSDPNIPSYSLNLSRETIQKIKKIGMEERVNDCVILGIRLLYQNNCIVTELEKASESSKEK
ncbi:hypothetical protein PCC7805_02534 [Planktothrix agardhii]|jgi:hypothetical protein|uniref:Uncharacterized protein n=1 Tax=Planktothrix agardhii TaxID=1160 RepID=A0A1J1JF87_PLAAG|nr:hypothetical protein [Planktothrix agardhii]MCF3609369.1 hypothetical protein [Planktothrix agardhii 1033]BBD55641.1 hypothetical protein NIES204_29570 [Planktothrix agardhii NIES-204]MBG0748444.1 hypothetical protein [Planktothrix agardhii KL2]MCB8749923.1 hypothetical protein [Planktothrix agardhii 1810]MCB8758672.1 hypothetical protein [Planktothrix agardhii 1813]